MKLSSKARYAVMAMVDLAAQRSAKPMPLASIAERQSLSLPYLEQLFCKLRRRGLVASVRGPGGGYVSCRGCDEVTIGEIVRAVEEPLRATRCQPGRPVGCGADGERCNAHDLWEQLDRQIALYLDAVTVADVLGGTLPVARQPEHGHRPAALTPRHQGQEITAPAAGGN